MYCVGSLGAYDILVWRGGPNLLRLLVVVLRPCIVLGSLQAQRNVQLVSGGFVFLGQN